MKIVVVAQEVPEPGFNGSSLLLWSTLEAARMAGHDCTFVWIHPQEVESGPSEGFGAMQTEKIPTVSVTMPEPVRSSAWRRLRRAVKPAPIDLYPLMALRPELARRLEEIEPDVVIAYEARIAAAVPVDAPLLVLTIDPDHMSAVYEFRQARLALSRRYLALLARALHHQIWRRRAFLAILRSADGVVNFAGHHAEWLRARGIDCTYLPMPIADPGYAAQAQPAGSTPRILFVGQMGGSATRAGLRLLTGEVAEELRRHLGPRSFEVRIAGAFPDVLPPDIKASLAQEEIRVLGYVEDLAEEFRSAQVVVVPTPIELGTRVRVLVAFSYGACVVSHEANTKGIPQLQNRYNTLLAASGRSFAQAVLEAIDDPDLRLQLGKNARDTYEKYFSLGTAGSGLLAEAERITQRRALSG